MYRFGNAVLGLFAFVVAILAVVLGLYVLIGSKSQLAFAIWASVFLSVVTPLVIIAIRHQIRWTRIKLIELFAASFDFNPDPPQKAVADGRRGGNGKGDRDNVSFEFVKGKYYADLDDSNTVPRFPMMLHADWMLLLCAVPFMVISGFGSFVLFAPLADVATISDNAAVGSWLWPSMLVLGGADATSIETPALYRMLHVNALTVALMAFSGAYFFSLRLLLRAVAVFDLSPVTFLRCFAHIVLAMLLAIVLYRVVPSAERFAEDASIQTRSGQTAAEGGNGARQAQATATDVRQPTSPPATPIPQAAVPASAPSGDAGSRVAEPASRGAQPPAAGQCFSLSGLLARLACPAPEPIYHPHFDSLGLRSPCADANSCPNGDATRGLNPLWLLFAFALGFIPDAALQYGMQKVGLNFKARYAKLDPHSKLIPLTILDGIDNFIAFRLEEANVFDVQNLAASNPIMLHIESPYGIYQTIDWVAQAQLCTVVGPERFLLLKTLNIRTIFDLERAVLPRRSSTKPPSVEIAPDEGLVLAIGAALFGDNNRDAELRKSFNLPTTLLTKEGGGTPSLGLTRHIVSVMIDDLHVHRLRQIWKHIAVQLGNDNASF